jgi:X-Pro dipeptidyl-peptidase-like protein
MAMHPLLAGAASLLLIAGAQAQCVDPPADGTYTEYLDQGLTLTDGYQTLLDIRIPGAAPGPCGWPMVALVHGSGTGRYQVISEAIQLAQRGYVTVSFDVRGQGLAMALNDPNIYGRGLLDLRERIDLFEVLEEAERLFPNLIDFDRLGVSGKSQGAVYSWIAAAHSGRALPSNPWRTAPAPTFKAIAPINFVPQFFENYFPGHATITELAMRQLYDPAQGIHSAPDVYTLIEPYLLAEDYDGLVQALYDPALDLPSLLATSTVPVLANLVYDDVFGPANLLVRDWPQLMAPGTPKILNLTTTGHGTPTNLKEAQWTEFGRSLWFDFHLKGISNGIDEWEEFRFAVTPAEVAEYLAWGSMWDVKRSTTYPFSGSATEAWFLDGSGVLALAPPPSSSNTTLQHAWMQNVTVLDYAALLPTPEELQNNFVPLDTHSFVTPALTGERILLGVTKVRLNAASADSDYQIHASLFDQTQNRYITGGTVTVRGSSSNQEVPIEIVLNQTTYKLAPGTQLRLEIDNLAWHRPPSGASFLHGLPVFQDYSVDLRFGGSNPAQLELPLVNFSQPSLITSKVVTSRFGGDPSRLITNFHQDLAGWKYQVLASASGTLPGFNYLGSPVNLNRDFLTDLILNNPAGLPITNFSGTLQSADRDITSRVLWNLQGNIPPSISRISFVTVLVDPSGTQAKVSNPVNMPIEG